MFYDSHGRTSGAAVPQSKSQCRAAGAHTQAARPGGTLGEDRTHRWRQQEAEAVDGPGRPLEASPQGKPPNRACNRCGVRKHRTRRPAMIVDTNALSAFADVLPPVVQQIAIADKL